MRQRSSPLARTARRPLTPRLGLEYLEARETPAQLGVLDPTFGTAGTVLADLGITNGFTPIDAAVDSLGRTVVVGNSNITGSDADIAVVRLNADGSVDKTFGTKFVGEAKVDDFASAVAIGPNNTIVIAGINGILGSHKFEVAQLDSTGAPVTGFQTNGMVTFNITTSKDDIASAVAVDSATGNIVVVGNSITLNEAAVAQLSLTGTTAPTTATFKYDAGEKGSNAGAVTLSPSGDIVVAGISIQSGANKLGVAELDATSLAPTGTFGAKNFALPTGVNSVDGIAHGGVATDAAGNVYVAQNVTTAADSGIIAVTKITTAGAADASFGTGGTFLSSLTGTGTMIPSAELAVKPGGTILVAGNTGPAATQDYALFQLSPAGALDPTFNPSGTTPGVLILDISQGKSDNLAGFDVAANGRVVLVGQDVANTKLEAARVFGSVELPSGVAVSGTLDGKAAVYNPAAGNPGQLGTTPIPATPFSNLNVAVRTTTADVDGDGVPDLIAVTGPGTPIQVTVISGADGKTVLVAPFDPFGGGFTGGGFVAAGDFNGDGRAEFVVTPDQGGGPRVSIFTLGADGKVATLANFFGIDDPNFRGGARTAVGDINGDGVPDLAVAAGYLGGPRISIYDGKTVLSDSRTHLVNDFFGFPGTDAQNLRNGAFVALGDVNGDGYADLILGGGPGGAPRVFILSGKQIAANDVAGAQANPIANFYVANNSTGRGGVRVAANDVDGDGKADVTVGSGEGVAAGVRVYLGKNFTSTGEPSTFQDIAPFGGAMLAGGVYVG